MATNQKVSLTDLPRRQFIAASGAAICSLSTSNLTWANQDSMRSESQRAIPLGFDNFSIRALKWNASEILDFAGKQKVDSLLLSDLDVYENHEKKYLRDLARKASDLGIIVHAGTGSICPTAGRWNNKWGSAEEHLRLGIRIASEIGSPVFRCYLGGEKDRRTEGGIQKHIDRTVGVLKKVKSAAMDANVKIAVENHAGDMQARELVGLIEAAGPEFVGATIDSGNATWTLEDPIENLKILGPHAVSSGMRDSTAWLTDTGARVAWNAVGDGLVDWGKYTELFAKLCPGVPFQLEIISGFNKPFDFKKDEFWTAYPDVKAVDYEAFLRLARRGQPIAAGRANEPEFQVQELLNSLKYCRDVLKMGNHK
ncbi:sugar phosphate isomerase/epimerase [Mariniblastus sp.]|nr:sugar phosphate isomerase/epimerase [Mariniblastus sp.]